MDPLDQYLSDKIHGNFFQKSSLIILAFLVFVCTCFMTIGSLVLSQLEDDLKLSTLQKSIISGFSSAGAILGIIFANLVWQKVGPIRTLKFSLFIPLLYGVIVYYAQDFNFIVLAWTIQNICVGIGNIPIGVYLTETAPVASRGRWTVTFGAFATGGRITSALLSQFLIDKKVNGSWKYPLYVQVLLYVIIAIPLISYFQESLRYLYTHQKFEKLVLAINRIIRINQGKITDKKIEFATIDEVRALSQMKLQNAEENPSDFDQLKELFGKKYRTITIVLIFVWIAENVQFNGLTMILPFWYKKFGVKDEFLLTGLTFASELVAMGTIYFMIDNKTFGRKKSIQIFGTASCILFATSYFFTDQNVLTGFFFCERYCMKSILILLFTYTSEIYPTKIRNLGISINDMTSSIMNCLLPFAVFFLFDWYAYSIIVLFFGSAAILITLTLFLWKDRTQKSLDLTKSMISNGEFL